MHIVMLLHHLDDRGIAQAVTDVARHMPRRGVRVSLVATRADEAARKAVPPEVPLVLAGAAVNRTAFAVPALIDHLRRLAPDVIFSHHNGPNRATAIARLLGRVRARHVTVEHIDYAARIPPPGSRQAPEWVRDRATRFLYRRADLVGGVAPEIVDDLVHRFDLDAGRTVVLPAPGRSLDAVRALAAEEVDHPWYRADGAKIICCVANVIPRKGQHLLVEALPRIRAQVGDVRLVLVGRFDDAGYRARVAATAERLGVGAHVAMVGFQPNPIVWLARADAFALASFNEGCPRVLSEAMAAGVPIVSTNCRSGPSFILDGGRCGVLVPTGNAARLADALTKVLCDRELAGRLVAAGTQRASRFTGEYIAPEYIAAAERVLAAV